MLKKTYLAILSIAIVSVLLGSLFYNVTFAPKPTQPTEVEVINFPLDDLGNLKVSDRAFQEPPSLSSEPINLQDVIADLENLGCMVVEVSSYSSYDFNVKNYTEFRRIAYNSKVVFWKQNSGWVDLFTIFNGMAIYYPYRF